MTLKKLDSINPGCQNIDFTHTAPALELVSAGRSNYTTVQSTPNSLIHSAPLRHSILLARADDKKGDSSSTDSKNVDYDALRYSEARLRLSLSLDKEGALKNMYSVALNSKNEDIRRRSAISLVTSDDEIMRKEGLKILVSLASTAKSEFLRYLASGELVSFSDDTIMKKEGLKKLVELATTAKDEQIQCYASDSLATSGDKTSEMWGLKNLRKLTLSAKNEMTRFCAARALIFLNDETSKNNKIISDLLTTTADEQRQLKMAVLILKHYMLSHLKQTALKTLTEIMVNSKDVELKFSAACAVNLFGDEILRKEAVKFFSEVVASLKDEQSRYIAAQAMANIGDEKTKNEGLKVIQNLVSNAKSELVRMQAAEYLLARGNKESKLLGIKALKYLAANAKNEQMRIDTALMLVSQKEDEDAKKGAIKILQDFASKEASKDWHVHYKYRIREILKKN